MTLTNKQSKTIILKKLMMMLMLLSSLFMITGCDNTDLPVIDNDEVTISFDTGFYGVTVDDVSGIPGKKIDVPSDPVKPGYTFLGWVDENGEFVRLTVFPDMDTILYANWVEFGETTTYKIEFLTNSSQHLDTIYVDAGQEIPTLPELDFYEDEFLKYSFLEWELNDSSFELEIMPQENLVLRASWKTGEFAIYFDTTTDLEIEPVVGNYGDEIEAPEIGPTNVNSLFSGWLFEEKPFIFSSMPNGSITVTPNWFDTSGTYNEVTSLPKIFINLENDIPLQNVTRERYIDSNISIYSEDENLQLFSQSAEFKGRGNGSWDASGPKRGYRIKFYDKQEVFGESKSRHWVLLAGANFYDTTLLKTKLAFDMANDIFTDIEYASSTNWVELYVNGEYRGVYILAEHVRVQNNRVDIDSEFGVDDTGYLMEYDSYATNGILGIDYFMVDGYRYGFSIKSPDSDDYLEEGLTELEFQQQVDYIANYTRETLIAALNAPNSTEAYNTFLENADVESFIDMYLLHELFKNTDTGWSSFFMYKKPGGKLYAAPPWDFDATAGTNRGNQSPTGLYVAGSAAYESDFTSSELYLALMQVDAFEEQVKTRYIELYPDLLVYVEQYITTEFIVENEEALGKNFLFWSDNRGIDGMWGDYTTYSSLAQAETGWANEVDTLKNWFITRIQWLHDEWK